MQITAKVRCNTRQSTGDQDQITFGADYISDDGKTINAQWAKHTPGLSITMHVLPSVPFEPGKAYTLTFDDGE